MAAANRGDGDGDAGLGVVATDATTASIPSPTAATAAAAPPATTTTAAATTTVLATTAPLGPPSLTDVIAMLTTDPAAAGDKGIELFDRLQEVAGEEGRDQSKKARDLLKDIDAWVGDDLLLPAVADAARAALEPLARSGDSDEDEDD